MEPLSIVLMVILIIILGTIMALMLASYINAQTAKDAIVRFEGQPTLTPEEIAKQIADEIAKQKAQPPPQPPIGEDDYSTPIPIPPIADLPVETTPPTGLPGERIRDLQFIVPITSDSRRDFQSGGDRESIYNGDYLQYLDTQYGFIAALRDGQARLTSANGTLNFYGIPAQQFFINVNRGALVYQSASGSIQPRYVIVRWRPRASVGEPWRTYRALLYPQQQNLPRPYPIPEWPPRGRRGRGGEGRGGEGRGEGRGSGEGEGSGEGSGSRTTRPPPPLYGGR